MASVQVYIFKGVTTLSPVRMGFCWLLRPEAPLGPRQSKTAGHLNVNTEEKGTHITIDKGGEILKT